VKLVTFNGSGEQRLGALLDGGQLVDLTLAREHAKSAGAAGIEQPLPDDCGALLAAGRPAMECARRVVAWAAEHDDPSLLRANAVLLAVDAVRLLPPIACPPKVLCVGRNYADHVEEVGKPIPEHPVIFPRYASTLIGHQAPIIRPWISDQLDWEGELACVIGQRARHVRAEDAYEIVAGYSLFNDVSVRDFQLRGPQYTPGKNFDDSGPFGPALVTSDEVGDPHALDLSVRLNGDLVQAANTGEMIFGIPQLIEDISSWITLEPGDVIVTGSPSGTGHSRRPHRFLVPGDLVQVEIRELGVLENPVQQESERPR
jgi:acylpyruvate hydrolase